MTTTATPLLSVEGLAVAYGRVQALHGVSLSLNAGEIVSVIGPNGAGKTTLLSALIGLLPARAGSVSFEGRPLGDAEVEERVALGMNLVPESRALFAPMSVHDNLLMGAYIEHRRGRHRHQAALDEVYALFPRLKERRTQAAGTLSGGERQMLAIGRALMARPRLLMLDEPSLGLAPIIVREILQLVATLKSTGVGILLIEQNARAALQISDRGYVLETGELVLQGPSAELLDNPRVVASYLGAGKAGAQRLTAGAA